MQRSMACPDTDAKAAWRFAELSAQQMFYTTSTEPTGVTTPLVTSADLGEPPGDP